MHKLKLVVCSALFPAMALTGLSASYAQDTPNEAAQLSAGQTDRSQESPVKLPDSQTTAVGATQPSPADPYAVQSFFADFAHFAIGDTVPVLYRSKKYEVSQWQVRHLPAPEMHSHWTYMGGNYVMIADVDGKILQAESGEIFYKQ